MCSREIHDLVRGGSPIIVLAVPRRPFCDNFKRATEVSFFMQSQLDFSLETLQHHQSTCFLGFRNVIIPIIRFRVRTWRILKREDSFVLDLSQDAESLLEVGFRLTGKAHNEIGGKRDWTAAIAKAIN